MSMISKATSKHILEFKSLHNISNIIEVERHFLFIYETSVSEKENLKVEMKREYTI
jgi:hypothetical protein